MSGATVIVHPVAGAEDRPVVPFTEDEPAEARRHSMLVQWSPEDDRWLVTLPEFGDAHTHGASPAEAVEMGAEVVALGPSVLRGRGEDVPAPRVFGAA